MGENHHKPQVSYRVILSEEEGQRLDNYLIRILKGVPKGHIYRLIRGGEVRVNKKRAKPTCRLLPGDSVRIPPVRISVSDGAVPVNASIREKLEGAIIHEDERLLVLNKPAGMPVHGGSGLSFGVIEAIREIRQDTHYLELIHRLDKETSGCLLIAKKRSFLRAVQALFEARQIKKTYWLLAAGAWAGKKSVTIDLPLRKNHLQSGERMVLVDDVSGKPSKTRFKLIENYTGADACWLEAMPETGRTHQIRVHAASLQHPILGDAKYGQEKKPKTRLYLHARAIQFTLDGKPYTFQTNWDESCDETIQLLRTS